MTEIKVTKKDIQEAKRPDAVLEGATSAFDWMYARRTPLLGAVGVILVIGIVASVASAQSGKAAHVAGAKLSEAVEIGTRQVIEKKDGEKSTADEKSFPSKAEKNKALEDALVKLTDGNNGAARGATLRLAQLRFEQGKFDESISGFEAYLKDSTPGDLKLFALESLGYAYEAKGDAAKAGDTFSRLTEAGAPGRALFHKARLLEKAGKKDEARKAYEDVATTYDKEIVAGDARTRLELMDAPPAGTGTLDPAAAAPVEDKKAKPAKLPKKAATK